MERRGILAGLAAAAAGHAARSAAAAEDAPRVVYHLADLDKVVFVIGNIENHFAGMGGPSGVTIALVVHGPALRAFHRSGATPDVSARVASLSAAGLRPHACANTMRAQNVTVGDLLPGFAVADRGGVVRLTELQRQGYVYLRP